MDNTPPRRPTRRINGGIYHKKIIPFLKNTPKYLLMKELDSYSGTICIDNTFGKFEKWHL